jgi:hypothetical protein
MITSCIIFLATLGTPSTSGESDSYYLSNYLNCKDNVPVSMWEYAPLYYEFYDEENIDTAIRIGWCESRGKEKAVRTAEGNYDTGVMQFVSWTWNWLADNNYVPYWNEWVVLKNGRPYLEQKVSKTSFGFSFVPVQKSAYWNIYASSVLAEDIYGRTQWRDWSSSQWCWEDEKKFKIKWTSENY